MKVKDIKVINYELDSNSYYQVGIKWDICYNFFYTHKNEQLLNNSVTACGVLYDYLHAFGMTCRAAYFVGWNPNDLLSVVEYVASHPCGYDLDLSRANCLIMIFNDISRILSAKYLEQFGQERTPSPVAVTKIMMAVYGNVPAFDSRFCEKFRCLTRLHHEIPIFNNSFSVENIATIYRFYNDNKRGIDRIAHRHLRINETEEFETCYPIARLIDCYGWH